MPRRKSGKPIRMKTEEEGGVDTSAAALAAVAAAAAAAVADGEGVNGVETHGDDGASPDPAALLDTLRKGLGLPPADSDSNVCALCAQLLEDQRHLLKEFPPEDQLAREHHAGIHALQNGKTVEESMALCFTPSSNGVFSLGMPSSSSRKRPSPSMVGSGGPLEKKLREDSFLADCLPVISSGSVGKTNSKRANLTTFGGDDSGEDGDGWEAESSRLSTSTASFGVTPEKTRNQKISEAMQGKQKDKYPPGLKLRLSILSRHLKLHPELQAIPCDFAGCDYQLVPSSNQRHGSHVLSHSGKRPFSCGLCGLTQHSRDAAYNHFVRCHPGVPHQGNILDRVGEMDDFLMTVAHRCFPILNSLSTWFPDTPPAITNLIQRFLNPGDGSNVFAGDELLLCCDADVPRTEIGIFRHVAAHWTEPLFQCSHCSYAGQDVWEHVLDKHLLYSKKPLFEDLQGKNLNKLLAHFKRALALDDDDGFGFSAMDPLEHEEEEVEDEKDRESALGDFKKRMNLLRMEARKLAEEEVRLLCEYPKCGKEVTENCHIDAHLAGHLGKNLYECALCGFRNNHGLSRHFREKHPDTPISCVDRTHLLEPELNRALEISFPILAELEFWEKHSPEGKEGDDFKSETPQFDEKIFAARFEAQGRTLTCRACGVSIPRLGQFHAETDIRRHVFFHSKLPCFRCEICSEEVEAIWSHHSAQHWGKSMDFLDMQGKFDSKLAELTRKCFGLRKD